MLIMLAIYTRTFVRVYMCIIIIIIILFYKFFVIKKPPKTMKANSNVY